MIIQLCGLSGAGKSTLAALVKNRLCNEGIPAEIIDGDDYRAMLCRDLGFSQADRAENIRRLGFVASKLSAHGIICIISAINPYQDVRAELISTYENVYTVFADCSIPALIKRDTKGLYKRALLPQGHPDKVNNLTGVNDPFEAPVHPDLYLNTGKKTEASCAATFFSFIIHHLPANSRSRYIATRIAV